MVEGGIREPKCTCHAVRGHRALLAYVWWRTPGPSPSLQDTVRCPEAPAERPWSEYRR
jgi:hypothetical protein